MARRTRSPSASRAPGPSRRATLGALATSLVVLILGASGLWFWTRPVRLRAQAEAAAKAGDWSSALAAWHALNATSSATGATLVAEARANLALGRAGAAEDALARAVQADPASAEPWRLRLEILRVENRPLDALDVGWAALDAVPAHSRRAVLKGLTLALLADLSDDLARKTLARWAETPTDLNARVALLQRYASMPRASDPQRAERIAELREILHKSPSHYDAREALVSALADSGEPDLGRRVLDDWPGPEATRDARYWRLRGRWDLEYDHHPERAADAFRRALVELPHDWKTRFRLARALHALGLEDEARREAEVVAQTRETLDPVRLGRRLSADLDRPDHPVASQADLADLCARAGLTRLAKAWSTLEEPGPSF
jgi:tetratricopeptide (TPR) repeat protein